MMKSSPFKRDSLLGDSSPATTHLHNRLLHQAWHAFVEYRIELRHGEIEVLKIQDGLPVLAEVVKKKIKF